MCGDIDERMRMYGVVVVVTAGVDVRLEQHLIGRYRFEMYALTMLELVTKSQHEREDSSVLVQRRFELWQRSNDCIGAIVRVVGVVEAVVVVEILVLGMSLLRRYEREIVEENGVDRMIEALLGRRDDRDGGRYETIVSSESEVDQVPELENSGADVSKVLERRVQPMTPKQRRRVDRQLERRWREHKELGRHSLHREEASLEHHSSVVLGAAALHRCSNSSSGLMREISRESSAPQYR